MCAGHLDVEAHVDIYPTRPPIHRRTSQRATRCWDRLVDPIGEGLKLRSPIAVQRAGARKARLGCDEHEGRCGDDERQDEHNSDAALGSTPAACRGWVTQAGPEFRRLVRDAFSHDANRPIVDRDKASGASLTRPRQAARGSIRPATENRQYHSPRRRRRAGENCAELRGQEVTGFRRAAHHVGIRCDVRRCAVPVQRAMAQIQPEAT